jgi:glucose-specific phosphotransferase system IIA component
MNAGGGNVQIVFGVESDFLKTEIEKIIRGSPTPSTKQILSPLKGVVLSLSEIPDATFKEEMMGKTIAIRPTSGVVVAPFDGEVATLFHTRHAIGLIGADGVEVLIHVGIDTVKMNGEGFKAFVKTGDRVTRGQKLIEFDLPLIEKSAKSIITPIVVTNPESMKNPIAIPVGQEIKTGDALWNYS